MKFKYLFISIIVAVFLSSAISKDNSLKIGEEAPKIETINGNNVVVDATTGSKQRLISFWNPKIASSRISNINLSKEYGIENEKVEFISICTDGDEALMAEVIKLDGLQGIKNYSYSEISPRVFKDYDVKDNPKAFLLSNEGKIIKIL